MGNVNKVVPIDKSSTILTVILAIIFFGETENIFVKLVCTVFLSIGIFMMIEKKDYSGENKKGWIIYAVLSAVFAAATSILAKIGIDGVESNLGTALRTIVVLAMAWAVVFIKGKQKEIKNTDKKELGFICLSGIATGASWLCYYYAIQNGVVSIVVPIDKLSILVAISFSYLVFGERLSKKSAAGLFVMTLATVAMAIFG
jgi:transporter family protein